VQSKKKRLYVLEEGERKKKVKGNRRIATTVSTGR